MSDVLCMTYTNGCWQVRHKVSERAKKTLDLVAKFVEEDCIPYVHPRTML